MLIEERKAATEPPFFIFAQAEVPQEIPLPAATGCYYRENPSIKAGA
jgi:hypothetical protein